jgi:hypothetical protein
MPPSARTQKVSLYFLLLILFLQSLAALGQPLLDHAAPVRIYSIKPGLDYLYRLTPPSHTYLFPLTDMRRLSAMSFKMRNLPAIGGLTALTAMLVARDQALVNDAKRLGDQWGIPHTYAQSRLAKWTFRLGEKNVDASLNVPSDLETGMYYLGDGVLHSAIGLSFWGGGKLTGDERAAQTGVQCLETMVCTCVATQMLKHVTGRESPVVASTDGGKWQLLPNPVTYANNTAHYDAMPSGHIATAMGTITVIADNYPEKKWIRPVGYSLMGVLMYAMMNNGVHWASDYPFGIAIGYAVAKVVDARSRTVIADSPGKPNPLQHAQLIPYASPDGAGLTWSIQFH